MVNWYFIVFTFYIIHRRAAHMNVHSCLKHTSRRRQLPYKSTVFPSARFTYQMIPHCNIHYKHWKVNILNLSSTSDKTKFNCSEPDKLYKRLRITPDAKHK